MNGFSLHIEPPSYVELAKKWFGVNFVTIFGDLYQNKLWGICNNFNQFTYLSFMSGPSNDDIKKSGHQTITV